MTKITLQNSLITILLLCGFAVKSQSLDWVKSNGSIGSEHTILTKLDTDGNVYTTGSYTETLNYEDISLPYLGERDVFIEKRDTDGTILWVKNLSSINDVRAQAISVTNDGGIVITGIFDGTLDANPGSDTYNLVTNDYYDIYIIKLSSDGDFVWAKSYGSLEGDYVETVN